MRIPHHSGLRSLACGLFLAAAVPALAAQSLTSGALKGVVRGQDGNMLRGISLTLEGRAGNTITEMQTGFSGEFRLSGLVPGQYRLLAEQQGYQPVRLVGIIVAAGETTVLEITLERRPPPVTEIKEVVASGTRIGAAGGRTLEGDALARFDWRMDASDATRNLTETVWPTDGRSGFGVAASGLPGSVSRLIVDGVIESQLGHLGLRSDPVSVPAFSRDGLSQVRVLAAPIDAEWRGGIGSAFVAQTKTGRDRVRFAPFVRGSSAALGGRAIDNPFDSTATSFQVGAVLGGSVAQDTASFLLRFDYRSLQIPTSFPWENDSSTFQGGVYSLRERVALIALDTFALAGAASLVSPAVRTWKGATGMGKVDWMLSPSSRIGARVAFADWRERTPALGEGLSLGTGSALKGRNFSGSVGISTTSTSISNELRVGLSAARRDFDPATTPETALTADGIAFGGQAVAPAFFDLRTLDFSNAFQFSAGSHSLKAGVSATSSSYQYDYRYGGAGVFRFADLDRFAQARGTFYQAEGTEVARFAANDIGVFLQDSWLAAPDLQVIASVRYDLSPIPKNKVSFNSPWFLATGIRNDSLTTSKAGVSPRIGFVWDVRDWVFRGGVGLHFGGLDPTAFGEAMLYDGSVTVRRGSGVFSSWPLAPDPSLAPTVGPALTILNRTYRPPRALKAEFGLTRTLADGYAFHLTGSYNHTDFLLRRVDLNLAPEVGKTQEGRPIFGRLEQQGGFVSAQIGSNRRFTDFDLVSGLSPNGFSDHYEMTAALERRVNQSLTVAGAYTFSRTTDNVVGARAADPADQLSPFPKGIDGLDWDRGRSDFDVPHRANLSAEYRTTGKTQLTLAARFRVRSGLPFTPGFRPGIDLNADGGGNNDPVAITGLAGLNEALAASGCTGATIGVFAARNSCREKMQQSLDLHLAVGVPIGATGQRALIEVDAFNVVGTATGIVDRAAVLIDRAGTVTTDGAGNAVVPLLVNSRFGSLLARRGEPRLIRIGLRMGY
jgi:hypothetical protein